MKNVRRCGWAKSELALGYHDQEWGVPVRDDRLHFEMLTLEGAQAGLSWDTILAKRERYREVFAGFDPARVARFDRRRIERLLGDAGIVRNRLKVESTVSNARAFLELQKAEGSFDRWVRAFVGEPPRRTSARKVAGLRRALEGAEAARLPLRRLDHLLRVPPGDRARQRPRRGVFPARPGLIAGIGPAGHALRLV
jgi:DNA-3-methyladenine glycosylase I